ncbi:MAG TPA: hypothetical protein VKY31_09950 [Terriglobia bacterium]|nr:hypothetical protein [Terriglobia bacterium]
MWVILLLAFSVTVQDVGQNRDRITLPDGNGAWIVHVSTSGGYSGQGTGDFEISSAGQVSCSPAGSKCPKTFEIGKLQPLIDAITMIAGYNVPFPSGPCNDCMTKHMSATWRDSMGVVHNKSFVWTDLSPGIPREIIDLYNAVLHAAELK